MRPRYEVTAAEIEASFSIAAPMGGGQAQDSNVHLPNPFEYLGGVQLERHPLEDTRFSYQLAVSYSTENPNFVEWRDRCQLAPSGSEVSGVVVFDSDQVIAAYTAGDGDQSRPAWSLQVHREYRKGSKKNPAGGLATLAVLQWNRAAPWLNIGVGWPVNPLSARVFVSAHNRYLRWAVERGDPVPQRVIDSIPALVDADRPVGASSAA